MSEARKCDRCNEFYSINDINEKRGEYPTTTTYKKSVGSMTLYDNNVNRIKHLDLCPKCSRSLIVWLNDYGQYDNTILDKLVEEDEDEEENVKDNTICKTCKFYSLSLNERPCCVCKNYDLYQAHVVIAKAEDVLKNAIISADIAKAEARDCKRCKYDNILAECDPCVYCNNYDRFEPKEDKE